VLKVDGWKSKTERVHVVEIGATQAESRFIVQKARDGAEYLASLGMTAICLVMNCGMFSEVEVGGNGFGVQASK
jgi:hypothetical protein